MRCAASGACISARAATRSSAARSRSSSSARSSSPRGAGCHRRAKSVRPSSHHRQDARPRRDVARRHPRLCHRSPLRFCCESRITPTSSESTAASSRIWGWRQKSSPDTRPEASLHSCSVNLPLTSAASASITSVACLPFASTVMLVPGPAASIIKPMMDVPPTTS
jgi:hypothetical protein